jgi:hypothetical protein
VRTLYDSTNPWAIPADAQMVAGYVDGKYAWPAEAWARFPNAVKVTLSAIGVAVAHAVDVEDGCVWPPENAVPWVLRARAAGYDPTVYCNRQNDLGPIRDAFDRAEVAQPHYWVAEYDGVREIPPGTVGKQHTAPEAPVHAPAPGHYDISSMLDFWPGIDNGDDDMPTADEIADAVWAKRFSGVLVGDSPEHNADGQPVWSTSAANALASMWGNAFNPTDQYASVKALAGQNAGLLAALNAMAERLGDGGQVDPAVIKQTVLDALREGTVHVTVAVEQAHAQADAAADA